ncbi:MAG TPA: hypothetical protein H9761_18725 [Candidatus Eisenbergiella merdavium]|uniref:Lipoprotein n=1 Tax=Candidatus Eisenbergiella merdavium TaxID=2838551 RepID=A0A9D2NJ73_9FIRM|nr:hypothetical protein [Candidatus Eisenbergiella merdavium]
MKKRKLKIFVLAMALCISGALSGCAVRTAAAQEPDRTSADISGSAAEAVESDEVILAEEQARAEEIRRAEIAEQYSVYEPYGMTYDEEKDRFFYQGQMVRCFKDQVSAEHTNAFFFDEGTVDVEPVRDTKGALIGLEQSSDADFRARTEKQAEIEAEFDAAGIAGESGSFELGDPDWRDDSLDAYTAFGVSYDKASENWIYDGRVIHILYDADHNTYCNNGVNNGIDLKVIRDKNGNVERLVEAEAQELEQYVK